MTQDEIQQIAARVAEVLAASSQGVGEVPVVDSVAGIVSLPAIKQVGSIETVVSAPIALLKGKDGREVSFRLTETAIQWQYTGGQWTDLITREVLLLPATDLMDALLQIITTWEESIKGEVDDAISNANTAAENVKDGKTPVIQNMPTAQVDPSLPAQVILTLVGTDENGNPVYQQTAQIPRAKLPIYFGTEEPTDPDILIWFNTAAFDPIRLTGGNMRISNNNIRK